MGHVTGIDRGIADALSDIAIVEYQNLMVARVGGACTDCQTDRRAVECQFRGRHALHILPGRGLESAHHTRIVGQIECGVVADSPGAGFGIAAIMNPLGCRHDISRLPFQGIRLVQPGQHTAPRNGPLGCDIVDHTGGRQKIDVSPKLIVPHFGPG